MRICSMVKWQVRHRNFFLSCVLILNGVQLARHFRYFLTLALIMCFFCQLHLIVRSSTPSNTSSFTFWGVRTVPGWLSDVPLSLQGSSPSPRSVVPILLLNEAIFSAAIRRVWHLWGPACSHICVSSLLPSAKAASLPKATRKIAAVSPTCHSM